MNFFGIIGEAIQALRSNILRSSLTIVGVVVGIFAVTAMLALGEGLSDNILSRFNSFAAGDITVTGSLNQRDLIWIKEQPYVGKVLAAQSVSRISVTVFDEGFSPTIEMYIGDYEDIKSIELVSGELFDTQNIDYNKKVALIDEGFLQAVAEDSGKEDVPQNIVVRGQKFEVIGVIEGGSRSFGRRGDGSVVIPYGSALGVVTNTKQFSSVGVSLVDSKHYEIAGSHILQSLNRSRFVAKDSDDYFTINSSKEIIESAQETTKMLTLFLGIIGVITLFVAGIGTMNMMLTTVTERTKEIGLRKAIGARNKDILFQILAESVMLTAIGGIIGVLITALGAVVANRLLDGNSIISVIVSYKVVVYAIVVAFVVGVVFGYYPAKNASKLQPVDALRAD